MKHQEQNQPSGLELPKNAEGLLQNNYQLISIEGIENTPFVMVRVEDNYFLAIGNERITELKNSEEEALNELTENMWDIIFKLACIVASKVNQITNTEKTSQNGN